MICVNLIDQKSANDLFKSWNSKFRTWGLTQDLRAKTWDLQNSDFVPPLSPTN